MRLEKWFCSISGCWPVDAQVFELIISRTYRYLYQFFSLQLIRLSSHCFISNIKVNFAASNDLEKFFFKK